MNTEKKAGFIVLRAQPYTLGHLDAVHQVAEDPEVSEVNIVIGSAQYKNYLGNPFSWEERARQIELSTSLDKPFRIFTLKDFHNPRLWAENLVSLTPDENKVVYTGNPKVAKPLTDLGVEVKGLEYRTNVRATPVREFMVNGGNWRSMVPEGTAQVIDEIGGVDRLIDLNNKHLRAGNTADIILEDSLGRIALIERGGEPFKGMLALPGGFCEVGRENLAQAATREAKEEVDADVDEKYLQLLGVYSDPDRDPRGPCVTAVYVAPIYDAQLTAGDDAKKIFLLHRDEIPEILAFDHRRILDEYFEKRDLGLFGNRFLFPATEKEVLNVR